MKFYNVNDFALWEDAWQLNQWFKPDNRNMPEQKWWYHFTGNKNITPPDDKFTQSDGLTSFTGQTWALFLGTAAKVDDRYEIMSFAAQSYSKAVGSMTGNTGFTDFIDLAGVVDGVKIWPTDTSGAQRPYSAHKWHSAQFRSTNMRQKNFWKVLLGPRAFNVIPQP